MIIWYHLFIKTQTKPRKKSSNPDKRRQDRDRRDCDRSGRRFAWSHEDRHIAWRSKRRSWSVLPRQPVMSWSILSFSPLSLSLFYFPRPEVIWSENRNGKSFPLFWLFDQLEMLFSLTEFEVTTKHPHFLENHFRNQFEVNSNAALVVFVICHKNK